MKHFFLTGDFQVGKSTLLKKVINELPVQSIGGFCTFTVWDLPEKKGSVYIGPAKDYFSENKKNSDNVVKKEAVSRVGIRGPMDCADKKTQSLSKGPVAYPEVFDQMGVKILEQAEETQLIIMDEIGKMEQKAEQFCARVRKLLEQSTPVFGVLRKEGNTPLQEWIRSQPSIELIEVSPENRDCLKEELVRRLQHEINRRIDSCGAFVFRKHEKQIQVLMIHGRKGWAFPKGRIEEGETLKETAIREVYEETGIRIKLTDHFSYDVPSGLPEEKRKVTYFLAEEAEGMIRPQFSEVRDAAWVTAEQAAKRIHFPEDLPAYLAAWDAFAGNKGGKK